MTPVKAREYMIRRLLHLDADEDDETNETAGPTPQPQQGGGKNTRLPYGLCERFHISLPKGATPRQAWEALKEGTGITAGDAYRHLKETGSVSGIKPAKKQRESTVTRKGNITIVASPQDFTSDTEISPFVKYANCPVSSNLKEKDVTTIMVTDKNGYRDTLGGDCEDAAIKIEEKYEQQGYSYKQINQFKEHEMTDYMSNVLSGLKPGTIVSFNVRTKTSGTYTAHYIKMENGKWQGFETQEEFENEDDYDEYEADNYASSKSRGAVLKENKLANEIARQMTDSYSIMLRFKEVKENSQFVIYNPKKDKESQKDGEYAPGKSCVQHPTPKDMTVPQVAEFLKNNSKIRSVNLTQAQHMTDEAARQISDAVISVKDFYCLDYVPTAIGSGVSSTANADYDPDNRSINIYDADIREPRTNTQNYIQYKRDYEHYKEEVAKIEANAEEARKKGDLAYKSYIRSYEYSMLDYYTQKRNEYEKKSKYSRFTVQKDGQAALCITLHEMGHAVSHMYLGDRFGKRLIKKVRAKAIANGDIYKISEYASHEYKDQARKAFRFDEFFAECFVAYQMGEPLPGYIREMIEYANYKAEKKRKQKN